jgi:hypothetical protein
MLIKILPDQIIQLWEEIKYAATIADEVDEKDLPKYLNNLLHSLLNEKAQCFVRIDDKREIVTIGITKLLFNNVTGEKYLQVQSGYGFKKAEDHLWKQDWEVMKEFAKKENCSYVGVASRNRRVWELGKLIGMTEMFRVFSVKL